MIGLGDVIKPLEWLADLAVAVAVAATLIWLDGNELYVRTKAWNLSIDFPCFIVIDLFYNYLVFILCIIYALMSSIVQESGCV